MKVNPDLISLCQDYLDNPTEEAENYLNQNTAYLEDEDWSKAIKFLIKNNKVEDALHYQSNFERFKVDNLKGWMGAKNFFSRVKIDASYHKRWNTKKNIEIELMEVFPEATKIDCAYEMVSQFTSLVRTKKQMETLTKITDEILTQNSLEETLNGWGEEEE